MRLGELWSLRDATRLGPIAGAAALLLWPAYAAWQEPVRLVFILALAVTALCGMSIILISATDFLTVARGRKVLPARLFDLALGIMLALPSTAALADFLG